MTLVRCLRVLLREIGPRTIIIDRLMKVPGMMLVWDQMLYLEGTSKEGPDTCAINVRPVVCPSAAMLSHPRQVRDPRCAPSAGGSRTENDLLSISKYPAIMDVRSSLFLDPPRF